MSDGVDVVVTLHALATYAESANHWTDDKRMMDASGVADTLYEAMDRIEELEERLKAAQDDAKEANAYANATCDRIEELEAELSEQIEWVKSLADDLIAAEGREARLKEKLAKAVEALGRIADDCEADYPPSHGAIKHDARATLAELTGGPKHGNE